MPEKIGDALKRAITQERTVEEVERGKKGEESLLLNPTRLEIFQFLCKNPCSNSRTIAKSLELSSTTSLWHLRKMTQSGLIASKKVGKNTVYYPSDMIDPEDVEVLSLLTADKVRLILSTIAANPGITQGELGKNLGMYQQEIGWFSKRLTEKRIINRVVDGRFRRYYVSERMDDILLTNRKRIGLFKKSLIRTLIKDGMNPEIIRSRKDSLVIQIGSGKEKSILKINLNLMPRFGPE